MLLALTCRRGLLGSGYATQCSATSVVQSYYRSRSVCATCHAFTSDEEQGHVELVMLGKASIGRQSYMDYVEAVQIFSVRACDSSVSSIEMMSNKCRHQFDF